MKDQDISIPLLRVMAEKLLDHVEQLNGSSISLQADYFWAIDPEDLYDPYHYPDVAKMTMGQVSECMELLEKALEDGDPEEGPGLLGYMLVWLSQVLEAIGRELPC